MLFETEIVPTTGSFGGGSCSCCSPCPVALVRDEATNRDEKERKPLLLAVLLLLLFLLLLLARVVLLVMGVAVVVIEVLL